jgi:hypothetical protein
MDWLLERQEGIEKTLARRHLAGEGFVLYDLSSSYVEGRCCPLAKRGYSRDTVKGKLQITYGLTCSPEGRPIAIAVHEGQHHRPTDVVWRGARGHRAVRDRARRDRRGPRNAHPSARQHGSDRAQAPKRPRRGLKDAARASRSARRPPHDHHRAQAARGPRDARRWSAHDATDRRDDRRRPRHAVSPPRSPPLAHGTLPPPPPSSRRPPPRPRNRPWRPIRPRHPPRSSSPSLHVAKAGQHRRRPSPQGSLSARGSVLSPTAIDGCG